ncbi:MAG: O-succinylbenzoate--CoA ligase [Jatrophihabitans sp.]|nr:MAG: O-succinylbenzoate--CoA ligase [Jatrophihabitans sp.]
MAAVGAKTLFDIVRGAGTTRGGHVFVEDARGDRRITYAQLRAAVDVWAGLWDARRVPSGAAVLVDVDDPLAFTAVHLAVIASGRCAVPVDPDAPAGELARTIRNTGTVLAVTDRRVRTGLPTVRVDVAAALPLGAGPAGPGMPVRVPSHRGAVRLSTSGSTGDPKCVELDEGRLLHVAAAVAAHHRLGERDRGYNPLPLFHINAEVVALLATLVSGGTLVLDRRFHRSGFWELLAGREVTWVNAVPAILTILADGAEPPTLGPLRFVRSASAPLPPEVRRRVQSMLAVPVVESYGMTEAASQITATPLDGPTPAGSAGRPVGVALQVRRPDGTPAAGGEVGRVWIRGDGVIRGYVAGRAADRFDADGWLDTGDLGRLDGDGFFFHAGRADDVINRGGEMVYPREVEEALLGHPQVQEAVVVGRPHHVLGSVPVAYVLAARRGRDRLVPELELLCERELSRFKRPAQFHVVDDLPRAPTGKIRRHELARAARTGA